MVSEFSKANVKVDQISVQHMTNFSRWRGGTTSSFDIFDSPLCVQLPGIVAWRSAVTRRDKPPVARAIRFGLTGVVIEAATSHGGFGHFPRFSSFPTRSHAWGNLHSHRPRRSGWVHLRCWKGWQWPGEKGAPCLVHASKSGSDFIWFYGIESGLLTPAAPATPAAMLNNIHRSISSHVALHSGSTLIITPLMLAFVAHSHPNRRSNSDRNAFALFHVTWCPREASQLSPWQY